jgi:hypothetical protein
MPGHRRARTHPWLSEEPRPAAAWMCRMGGPDPMTSWPALLEQARPGLLGGRMSYVERMYRALMGRPGRRANV